MLELWFESIRGNVITTKDVGKTVLLRFYYEDKQKSLWENPGAIVVGVALERHEIVIELHGQTMFMKPEYCRVLEPRPQKRGV